MRSLTLAFLLLTITTLNAQNMDAKAQDVVTQLFITTDQKQWDKVENCFAKEVFLDYSSMGNPSAHLSPSQIIEAWKTILPGFTYTHHQIGNIEEVYQGSTASVFAYGTASHYLEDANGSIWTVVGSYNFNLVKDEKQWRISAMKFNLKYQDGNLLLPQKAIKRVSDESKHESLAVRNKSTVEVFLRALENENASEVSNLFAENGRHCNPYHSNLFPTGAEGREDIKKYWEQVFPAFDGMDFSIHEIYAMEDPNMVYAKYTGSIRLKENGGLYSNEYYSTFKFNEDGEILEYVEIFNPIIAARGFGLLDKIK